jgi:hypothetical protein
MNENRTSNMLPKVLLGISGVVVFFVVLLPLQALFVKNQQDEEVRQKAAAATAETIRIRTEQLELLRFYRWVDKNKGIIAIPIERAMQLVVTEENAKPVAPVIRN